MEPLYILDGYGLIFRSYFAFIRAPRRAPDGRNVSAVFGFFRTLVSLFKEYGPKNFVVALDSAGPTFRDELFSGYKATRDATPEELKAQFPIIEEAVAKFGLPSIRLAGFEADDIIAALVSRCRGEGRACFVISSDKDLMQLVGGPVRMLRPTTKEGLVDMDRDAVYAEKGVYPEQIVDFLALTGDQSDNIPGVKGIGEKTAAKLLAEFGSLDGVYTALDEGRVTPKGAAEKLEAGRESAFFSKKLVMLADAEAWAALCDSAGLEGAGSSRCDEATEFPLSGLDAKALAAVLLPLGMKTLVADLGAASGQDLRSTVEAYTESADVLGGAVQGDLFGPDAGAEQSGRGSGTRRGGESGAGGVVSPRAEAPGPRTSAGSADSAGGAGVRTAGVHGAGSQPAAVAEVPGGVDDPAVADLARELAGAGADYRLVTSIDELRACVGELSSCEFLALDTETTGTDAMSADLVGISLCGEPGRAYYLPILGPADPGQTGPVLDPETVRGLLEPLLCAPRAKIVGQHIKFDMKVLRRWGLCVRPHFDTMIAAWVLEPAQSRFNMDALAELYLGYATIHYEDVIRGAGLSKDDSFALVPLSDACRYAAEDADVTFRLFRLFERLIASRGMEDLFYRLEMPLVPILADMEYEGIGLDAAALERFSGELAGRLGSIEAEIYRMVGYEFNINSTKQLQTVLFDERKLKPGKRTKTGYSTDTSVLEELALEDPVPQKILEYRGLAKLKSTYVDTLPSLVNPATGRIHTTFHQHGTATGRMSSKDPNLQNIPVKDEEGRKIRLAFTAAPGRRFVSADYSQIELVVLAHFARDEGLHSAFASGTDVHRATGSLIFGVAPGEVTPEQRRIAKTINFGVMYGMSAFRLSRELGISRHDAQGFIEAYFRTYTGISRFIADTAKQAEEDGGVRTIAGRFRRIPEIRSSNKTEHAAAERIAVNTPIQGSAADIVKTAMVRVDARLRSEKLAAKLILQVHDELILECPEGEVETVKRLLAEEMTGAVELSVPLSVAVESGLRWGEMH